MITTTTETTTTIKTNVPQSQNLEKYGSQNVLFLTLLETLSNWAVRFYGFGH